MCAESANSGYAPDNEVMDGSGTHYEHHAPEIFIDEVTVANLIDQLDWKYEAGAWTVTLPQEGRSPLEDAVHEYLSEVGEPLE